MRCFRDKTGHRRSAAPAGYCRCVSTEPLRCAGALIVDDDGRIFIQRRSPHRRLFPNCWDIVGGHLEPGEDVDGGTAPGGHRGDRLDPLARPRPGRASTATSATTAWTGPRPTSWSGSTATSTGPALEAGKHTEFRWLAEHDVDSARRAPRRQRRADPTDRRGGLRRPAVDRSVNDASNWRPHRFAGLVAPAVDRAFRRRHARRPGRRWRRAEPSGTAGRPRPASWSSSAPGWPRPAATVDGPGLRGGHPLPGPGRLPAGRWTSRWRTG